MKFKAKTLLLALLGLAILAITSLYLVRHIPGLIPYKQIPNEGDLPTKNGTVITVRGRQICLRKPTKGPQTLECAIGLRTNDGKDYAIEDTSGDYRYIAQITGEVEVTGELRATTDSKYISEGTIKITFVKKLGD